MASLDSKVNDLLKKMHTIGKGDGGDISKKGSVGELAVFNICEHFYQTEGGILIHSYAHDTDPDLQGNIKKNEEGIPYVEHLGSTSEIDVLYISKYRVFPIEVKSYHAKQIVFTDNGIKGSAQDSKSPVHQNEMHCRHLYSKIFRAFTNGNTEFIVPIVVMVDRVQIVDNRSDWQRDYIKLCIIDELAEVIQRYNTPIGYQLNLQLVNNILKESVQSTEKWLPPRM